MFYDLTRAVTVKNMEKKFNTLILCGFVGKFYFYTYMGTNLIMPHYVI